MGWKNDQVTPSNDTHLPAGASKPNSDWAPQKVGEPRWQQIVSVVVIGTAIVLYFGWWVFTIGSKML